MDKNNIMKTKYIILLVTLMSITSCIANKNMKNCEIKEISEFTVQKDGSYYIKAKFNHCELNVDRENLIKEEMKKRFPTINDKAIFVKEYLGKIYNEYKYEVRIE